MYIKPNKIINGQVLNGIFGKFTCFTPNGTSTVDYVLSSECILEQILYMKVCNFIATLSDCHCMLEWSLSAKYCVEPNIGDVCTHEKSPGLYGQMTRQTFFERPLNLRKFSVNSKKI
jgi:hypothetical protein